MCSLARSLDVLGERWTVLVIRELLLGPKRFKHLLTALPAIGTNRLSERLKSLEAAGIARKVELPAPAAVPAYELTAYGERLREPLLALGLWGVALPVDERVDPSTARAELVALTLTATQQHPADPARTETFEFSVGEETFHFALRDGRFIARSGPSTAEPLLRVACDLPTFIDLAGGALTPAKALKDRRAEIHSGGRKSFTELFKLLEYTPAPGPA